MVSITLGNGLMVVITIDDKLQLRSIDNEVKAEFGEATLSRISNIQESLERLKIHAKEEK